VDEDALDEASADSFPASDPIASVTPTVSGCAAQPPADPEPPAPGGDPARGTASMTTARENLISWLRDAHAMEGQAITLLETQLERLEHYPEAKPRLQQHLQQTRDQVAAVERCLGKLGADPSTFKDSAMKLSATMQGMMSAMSTDEVLKHALASSAFEQFEASSYRSLVAAAEQAGESEIARTCEQLMKEEQDMAKWMWDQIPHLTKQYLAREATGASAKR
jgi:ferritin-like metal-binding protein YciE